MKGSPLGVGTDIGGCVPTTSSNAAQIRLTFHSSLRIPAAFCGLYTLRPSYSRLPYHGAANALSGQESILSVLGPMTNSLSGIKEFMTAVLAERPWNLDPLVIRKPWSEAEWNLCEHGGMGARLCFAIMWDNGVVKPHPPLLRAMRVVKKALEAAGHRGKLACCGAVVFEVLIYG